MFLLVCAFTNITYSDINISYFQIVLRVVHHEYSPHTVTFVLHVMKYPHLKLKQNTVYTFIFITTSKHRIHKATQTVVTSLGTICNCIV